MSSRTEPACTDVVDLIEPYLDGEEGRQGLERHLAHCSACSQELALARKVRDGLRSLPEMPCSEGVIERVRSSLQVAADSRWRRPRWRNAKPLLAAAAVLVVVLSALAIQRLTTAPEQALTVAVSEPSAEVAPDLEQAEEELRLAFAYLGALSRRAGLTLRDEVIVPGVFTGLWPRSAFGPQEKRP